MELSKRDQIIEQAFKIFYENGFHASGVDSLLEGTGISKRTLYKHFGSKEGLIEETISHYRKKYLDLMRPPAPSKKQDPLQTILEPFDRIIELVEAGHENGCYAINAKLEYAGKNERIETVCGLFFDEIDADFLLPCKELKVRDAKLVAAQIAIIYRGATVSAQHTKNSEPIIAAKKIVRMLLKAAGSK